MSYQTEIEFKTLLTAEEYQRTIAHFHLQSSDFFTQENHYFDTNTFALKEQHSGLRFRLLEDMAEFTLKVPAEEGLLEITDTYPLAQAQHWLTQHTLPTSGHVIAHLAQLHIEPTDLINIGSLKTKRAQKQLPIGLLALDESWYGSAHDFELELEVEETTSGKQDFIHLTESLNIKVKPTLNKIQRMMQATQQ